MEGSLRLFLQIAHVSAQMSQLHIATAFHFLISNLGAVFDFDSTLVSDLPSVGFAEVAYERNETR